MTGILSQYSFMDEQEFRKHSDHALTTLNRLLIAAADDFGFEVDLNNGALTIEFEDPPAKFVVSPNAPVRQIWVSALSKSFKLDWDEVEATFVLPDSKESLKTLMERVIGQQLKEDISL